MIYTFYIYIYSSTNYEEFNEPIKQSLIDLSDEHKKLFDSLVIFRDDFYIPIKVIILYFFVW